MTPLHDRLHVTVSAIPAGTIAIGEGYAKILCGKFEVGLCWIDHLGKVLGQ